MLICLTVVPHIAYNDLSWNPSWEILILGLLHEHLRNLLFVHVSFLFTQITVITLLECIHLSSHPCPWTSIDTVQYALWHVAGQQQIPSKSLFFGFFLQSAFYTMPQQYCILSVLSLAIRVGLFWSISLPVSSIFCKSVVSFRREVILGDSKVVEHSVAWVASRNTKHMGHKRKKK